MGKKHTQQLTQRCSWEGANLLFGQVQELWGTAGQGFMPSVGQTATHREVVMGKG